jgi:hypothetical protein
MKAKYSSRINAKNYYSENFPEIKKSPTRYEERIPHNWNIEQQ